MSTTTATPVVVITGASGGIGAAIALVLAETKNYRITIIARRTTELNAVADKCKAFVGQDNVLAITADATNASEVNEVAKKSISQFGRIDVWINNVGRGVIAPPSTVTSQQIHEMIDINVVSAVYGIQAVLPHFKETGRGQIINVSSVLGRNSELFPAFASYAAAKYYLNGLSEALRAELREDFPNITITTVAPGLTATEFAVNAGGQPLNLPNTQTAEEVARAVLKYGIEDKLNEVYTNPIHKPILRQYLNSLVPE